MKAGAGIMMDHDTQVQTDFRLASLGAAVPGAATWPEDTAGAPQARLLFVGSQDYAPDIDRACGVRLVAAISASHAADHVRQMGTIDIVWLAAAETIEIETLTDLCAAVAERKCNLICETTLVALDRVTAAIPESLWTEYLVDADATDRLVALAAARRVPQMAVHDIARDDTMDRIDRLQEEVARISRLLGDLAGQRSLGGPPPGFTPWNDDVAEYPEQVRSPPRDYAAIPRSFVPEERTLDRQRAKAVRRMLRQRRMREQYFPADLFADPAWDMLLDLYAARLERQPVSVSSLCIAAAVPATTALRWIKTMTDAGLFVREADPHDGRRIFIALAEAAYDSLARYFEAMEE